MQQQRDPAAGERRGRLPPEHLLEPHGQHRLVRRVVDPHARAARHLDPFGRQLVQPTRLRPRQQPAQRREDVDPPEVAGAADPGQLGTQPGLDARRQRLVRHVRPRLPQRPVEEGHPPTQGRGRVGPGQRGEPLEPQPLAHRGGHQRGSRVRERARRQLDRAQAGLQLGDHPPVGPADLLLLVPQRRGRLQRQVLGERGGRPDGGVPLAGPAIGVGDGDPRQARQGRRAGGERPRPSRTPSGTPTSRAGAGRCGPDAPARRRTRRRGRRAAPSPRPRSGRSWAGRPAAAGRATPQLPASGPPRRSDTQRGDEVAVADPHVLGDHRHDLRGAPRPHQGGPVEQRAGEPGVGADPRDRAAAVGHRAVVGHGPEGGERGPGRRHRPGRRLVQQRQAGCRPGSPRRPARARTTSGPRSRSRGPGAARGGRARPGTTAGRPRPAPPARPGRPAAPRRPG